MSINKLSKLWARLHAIDLISTAFLFISASLFAGRVWRFPFDDETYTLSLIDSTAPHTPSFFQDIHPPLAYIVFYGLRQIGLTDAEMRLFSLAMTLAALLLFQYLVLTWTAQRNNGSNTAYTRLISVVLFGLCPLAIDQGDALRWYPLFAIFVALFITLYLVARSNTTRIWSGLALGLAGSTNFLGGLLILPFMVYRYGLQRQFRWSFDAAFWLLAAAGAVLGFFSTYLLLTSRLDDVQSQFDGGAQAVLKDVLGFFGGNTLGISQAWIVAPTAIIFLVAAISEIKKKEPSQPSHLLLLVLASTVFVALGGFAKPRSFLYLAPMAAALLTLFLDQFTQRRETTYVVPITTLLLASFVATIANINFGTHPFKRNLAIPYQSVLDFIDSNEKGQVLIASTDPVVPYALRGAEGHCAKYFLEVANCIEANQHYDSVFVISGHNDKSDDPVQMQQFNLLVDQVLKDRIKVATFRAGLDEEAGLKTRLTHTKLEKFILQVDFYQ